MDGVTETVAPDGTKTEVETAPDPRWGAQVPVVAVTTVTTPDGKVSTVKRTDTVALAMPRNPFSVTFLQTQFAETGGGTRKWAYNSGDESNPDDQTVMETSAEGRITTTTLDRYGRVLKQADGTGLAAREFTYDASGRPKAMKQGAESITFAYDAKHRLASETDAAEQRRRRTATTTPTACSSGACRAGACTATPRTPTATSRR